MTRRLLEEEPGEVDVFAGEMNDVWEDVLQEIDTLFRHLQASQQVRGVVLLRMDGHSVSEIAGCLHIGVEDVRGRLADAGRLLINAGVVKAPAGRELPPRLCPGVNSSPSLLQGLVAPGAFRRRRQSIWRQSAPPPKRPLRLTKGPMAPSTSDGTSVVSAPHAAARTPNTACRTPNTIRPLTPVQSFGWRDVYYAEVHRYGLKR